MSFKHKGSFSGSRLQTVFRDRLTYESRNKPHKLIFPHSSTLVKPDVCHWIYLKSLWSTVKGDCSGGDTRQRAPVLSNQQHKAHCTDADNAWGLSGIKNQGKKCSWVDLRLIEAKKKNIKKSMLRGRKSQPTIKFIISSQSGNILALLL